MKPPHDPHALALKILADPRFRMHVAGRPVRTWWDALLSWLGDRWNDFARLLGHRLQVGANVQVAIGDVLLFAAAAIAVTMLVRLLATATRAAAPGSGAETEPRLAAEALYARSRELARAGAYREAISLLFRAALASLDVRGVLRDEPSLTVRDGRIEIRRRAPHYAADYDALAAIFTAAFYAETPADFEQWSAASRAYAALARALPDAT